MCEVDLWSFIADSVDKELPCAHLTGLESCVLVPQVHGGTKLRSSGVSAKSDSKIGKKI